MLSVSLPDNASVIFALYCRSQILETMYHIIRVDYLHSWKGLLPKIMENIKTQDGMRVYAALDSLRMIFKHYR